MAKHTPGPWKVSHSGYSNAPFVIFAGERVPDYKSKFPLSGVNAIAEVFQDESPAHEEQAANARLIVAVPELLEALRSAWQSQPESWWRANAPEAHAQIRAAIQKAEGEVTR